MRVLGGTGGSGLLDLNIFYRMSITDLTRSKGCDVIELQDREKPKEKTMWLLDQIIIAPARAWAWILDRRNDRRMHREARRRKLRAGKETL